MYLRLALELKQYKVLDLSRYQALWLKKSEQLRLGLNQAISYEKICAPGSCKGAFNGCISNKWWHIQPEKASAFEAHS
jgi:hypothetical protein